MMTKLTTQLVLFTVACILLAPPPLATAFDIGRPSISANSSYSRETGFDSIPGTKVAVSRFGAALVWPLRLNAKTGLALNANVNRFNFYWDNSDKIVFSNGARLWSRLHTAEANLRLNHKFNPRWSGFTGLGLGFGWEDEISDAFSFGAVLGIGYRFGSNWDLSLGLASGEMPFGGYFGPFGSIGWHQERLENFQPGWFAKLAFPPSWEVGYGFSDKWRLRAFFGVYGGLFRLADDNNASPSGYFAPTVDVIGCYLDYRPIPALVLSIGAKYNTYTEWKILDEDGDTMRTLELDNTPSVELKMSYLF